MFDVDETGTLKNILSEGVGGLYDGVQSSLTDFSEDYNNEAALTLMGGGSAGGLATKMCMAAFGYDWDLSMDTILDSAYQSEFRSTVVPLVPRRNYLFINPTTGSAIFEYRGAFMITAGCEIQSYTIDAVCITEKEVNLKKGAYCKSNEACPCLRLISETQVNYPRGIPLKQGGRIAQTAVEEPAYAYVADNTNYVYDHMKVTLNYDKTKYPKCMEAGYEDGIFYFPISDTTAGGTLFGIPLALGCTVSPTTGQISCINGIAKELGFGNMQLNLIEMDKSAYVGDTLNAKVFITKTGSEKMCLRAKVYKDTVEGGNMVLSNPLDYEVIQTYTNQEFLITLFNPVPKDIIGSGATYIREIAGTAKEQFSITEVVDQGSKGTGTLVMKFTENNGDKIITCDKDSKDLVSFNHGPNIQCTNPDFSDGSRSVKVLGISKVGGIAQNEEVTLTYKFNTAGDVKNEQPMTLLIEAGIPDKKTGSCTTSQPITVSGSNIREQFTVYRTKSLLTCTSADLNNEVVVNDCMCNIENCFKGEKCSIEPTFKILKCDKTKTGMMTPTNVGSIEIRTGTTLLNPENVAPGTNAIKLITEQNYRLLIGKTANDGSTATFILGEGQTVNTMEDKGTYFESVIFYYPTASGLRTITATIKSKEGQETKRTIEVYVVPSGTSSGIALEGICGITPTGKCKIASDCTNPDNIIMASSISDESKKCLGSLICCK